MRRWPLDQRTTATVSGLIIAAAIAVFGVTDAVLTHENAYPSAGLVAQQMPAHTITMRVGHARIAVLGDIPTGGNLQVAGGGSCVVVAGVVAPGATVHAEGGGATVVLSQSNSQSQPGVSAAGGGARILIREIDPHHLFKSCDELS